MMSRRHYRALSRFTIAVAFAAATSTALAHEKTIRRADVPTAVLTAVAAKHQNAKVTHFAKEVEGGKVLYEVTLQASSGRTEVSVTPEGTIVAEEVAIAVKDLPSAVRQSLAASRFGGATVLRAERVTEAATPDVTTFELVVSLSGKRHELVYNETGKLERVE